MLAGATFSSPMDNAVLDNIPLKQLTAKEPADPLRCQGTVNLKPSPKGIKLGNKRKKRQSVGNFLLLASLTSMDMLHEDLTEHGYGDSH